MTAARTDAVRQYAIVTGNYWAFTLTDGALRMLVVLHFHALGFSPLDIALLFLFYEFFGVVTNLFGGWIGARVGLHRTLHLGLLLQVIALCLLLVPSSWLTVPWVMGAQALSGIAKDLNKMSAKSAIKLLVPADAPGRLYHWVAVLTGSKNALKGAGYFLGGALLALLGFAGAVAAMAIGLLVVFALSLLLLQGTPGKLSQAPKFRELFSRSRAINLLAAARLFLFGARDVWFVVALPVFLSQSLGWPPGQTGGFLALWVIGYGAVQAIAPRITGPHPQGGAARGWAAGLMLIPAAIAMALGQADSTTTTLIGGLLLFGAVFAVNSSLHSFLIVHYARHSGVSLDVGFYYMANALGRLAGTVLSGAVFQAAGQGSAGLQACLWLSSGFLAAALVFSFGLPRGGNESV